MSERFSDFMSSKLRFQIDDVCSIICTVTGLLLMTRIIAPDVTTCAGIAFIALGGSIANASSVKTIRLALDAAEHPAVKEEA